MRDRQVKSVSGLLLAVAMFVAACSSPAASTIPSAPSAPPSATARAAATPAAGTPTAATPSTATPAPGALECEAEAFPGSLSDVAPEVLERSDALADEVAAELHAGGTIADATARLKAQAGMAEVESDDVVIRFRLAGGRSVWVMTAGAFAPGAESAGAPASQAIVEPFSLVASYSITGGDEEAKAAVVLSPFLWDFAGTDEGARVADVLEGARGYAGNVRYIANPTRTSTNVGIDSFKGWRGNQVVHVSSHGAQLCKKPPCRAIVAAGILTGEPVTITEPGVETIKSVVTDRTYVALTADFFRNQYPGGLEETFVFFNSCKSHGAPATDLGDAIRGQSSVYLSWSEVVDSVAASEASAALYTSLARDGLAVEPAHDVLGTLQVDPDPAGKQARLAVAGPSNGNDLRIRQVVAFRSSSGAFLRKSDRVAIRGRSGDGVPDRVPYQVTVDGVAPETAPLATVRVTIDGQAAAPVELSTGSEIAPGRWSISGEIDLGYDLVGEKVVDFEATADLPEGGTSSHLTSATLAAIPSMGLTWSGWATDVGDANGDGSVKVRSRAELTFPYAPGQDGTETHPRYVLTAGTIMWRIDGTDSDGCRVLSRAMTVAITPAIDANSELVFDLTKNPVEYSASAGIHNGPLVEVAVTCPDKSSTYTTRVRFNGILADASDHLPVTGTVIAGSFRLGVGEYAWELRRRD